MQESIKMIELTITELEKGIRNKHYKKHNIFEEEKKKVCSHSYLRDNPDKDKCVCGGLRY